MSSVGLIDTTVLIHLLRKNPLDRAWLSAQTAALNITPINWLEIVYGASGKTGQAAAKALLNRFEMAYLTPNDMDWAMGQMERLRLSHGIGINDCLIASVAYRLQIPLYSHNLKDMQALLGNKLVLQPY